jgi:hypothetical protein
MFSQAMSPLLAFAALVVGLAGVSGRNAKIKIIQGFKIKHGINAT